MAKEFKIRTRNPELFLRDVQRILRAVRTELLQGGLVPVADLSGPADSLLLCVAQCGNDAGRI